MPIVFDNVILITTVKVLAANFSLVIAAAFLYLLVVEPRIQHKNWQRSFALGAGFGLLSIFSMLDPVVLKPGIQVDAKYPLVFMATLFGGFRVGGITLVTAILFRLLLGGIGIYVAIPTLVISWLAGGWIRLYRRRLPFSGGWFHTLNGLILCAIHALTGYIYYLVWTPEQFENLFIQRNFPVLILYPFLTLFLGLNLDFIHSRRILREQRSQLLLDLAQSNNDLRSLYYSLLHDLRAPLVNIRGFIGEALNHLEQEQTPQAIEDLQEVQKNALKLYRMLQGLSELDRVSRPTESGTAISYPDAVIRQLLNERPDIQQMADIEMAPGPWPQVLISPERLKQIFQSLVDNAIKFRRVTTPLTIHFSHFVHQTHAILSIKDNGQGIAPTLQTKVFNLFEQGKAGEQGMGLGLTLCQRIIERHHGKMWLESLGVGQGVTVFMELPIANAQESNTF